MKYFPGTTDQPFPRICASAAALAAVTLCFCATIRGEENTPGTGDTFEKVVTPFLQKYCTGCHGEDKQKGELNLATLSAPGNAASGVAEREAWAKVRNMLRRKEMPPKRRPQPEVEERERIIGWLDGTLSSLDCTGWIDPGRVTLRRLNRTEYNNTIRDLFGVDLNPADDFPADDIGYGFDNIGDVLSLPPVLFERYLDAAESIVSTIIVAPEDREDGEPLPDAHRRIITSRPGDGDDWREVARPILQRVAGRAFRRPVRERELEGLLDLVVLARNEAASFECGIQIALEAVLVSPTFLFHIVEDRVEDRARERPSDRPDRTDHLSKFELDDFELAARLSYFLWSSLPDEELAAVAAAGRLRDDAVLEAQVRRMLAHPASRSLARNFGGQWLQLRKLDTVAPDPEHFPAFDDELRRGIRRETELFLEEIVRKDRSVLEILDADFTYLNERLARHYGREDVKGDEFRRVSLDSEQRGGVLTHASILTLTSNPTRTSPVKRGKWILEQILGTPPPPPPPMVEDLSEAASEILAASLRERLENHRTDPSCASCHERMDPIGFAFENYDGIGAWRERDGKFPIDASGTLPDGAFFGGPREFRKVLLERRSGFCRCLAEKTLTYALGRGIEYHDECAVKRIVLALAGDEYRFSRLVLEVVKSIPFRYRRGPGQTRKQ